MSIAVGKILNAYYNAINGAVSCGVYKITVPESETGNYIWIYPEGGKDEDTKTTRAETVIIKIEIVTFFKNDVDHFILDSIESDMMSTIWGSPPTICLLIPPLGGVEIRNVTREDYTYSIDKTENGVIYRKTIRFSNRVVTI